MNAQRDAQQGGGTSNEQYALLGLFTSGTGYIYVHSRAPDSARPLSPLYPPMEPSNASLSSLMEG